MLTVFMKKCLLSMAAVLAIAGAAMAAQPTAKALNVDGGWGGSQANDCRVGADDGSFKPFMSLNPHAPLAGKYIKSQPSSLPSMVASPAKVQAAQSLLGVLVWSDLWKFEGVARPGVYNIPKQLGPMGYIGELGAAPNGGVCVKDGVLYATYFSSGLYGTSVAQMRFDLATGEYLGHRNGTLGSIGSDMATDPTTGEVYGCFYTDQATAMCFGKYDPVSMVRTPIKTFDNTDMYLNAVGINGAGTVYGITMNGKLYRIDKSTGSMRLVGDVKNSAGEIIKPKYITGGVIDPVTGVFYWAVDTEEGAWMYAVDTSNAKAELLYACPNKEEIVGLNIPYTAAAPTAPDMPSNFAATFSRGSLSGSISFKLPATLYNDEAAPAGADCKYIVKANGETIAEGEGKYNTQVRVSYAVETPQLITFSAAAINDAGQGPEAILTQWVGPDAPAAITNLHCTVDGLTATVSWDPVTTGLNSGYFRPADVTYKVVRFPEEVEVYNGSETTFTETLEPTDLTVYYYAVTPMYKEVSGYTQTTENYQLGAIRPPYLNEALNTAAGLRGFTIINANNDFFSAVSFGGVPMEGKPITWQQLELGTATVFLSPYYFSTNSEMDDWLILPPAKLQGQRTYEFSFSYYTTSAQQVEVYLGTAPTVEGMTIEMAPSTTLSPTEDFVKRTFAVDVESDGEYYFAIHHVTKASAQEGGTLQLADVAISNPFTKDMPREMTALTLTPDWNGALSCEVKATMPTKTMGDVDITEPMKMNVYRNDELVGSSEPVAAGQVASFVDNNMTESGIYKYTVAAVNADGEGRTAEASIFVGVNNPANVPSSTMVETDTEGTVKLDWTAPETDVNGQPINPSLLSYTIYGIDDDNKTYVIADDLTDLTYTIKVCEPGDEQRFVYFGLQAKSAAGTSPSIVATPMIPVGKPYTDYNETFSVDCAPGTNYLLGVRSLTSGTSWGLASDETFAKLEAPFGSRNGDNGFIYMNGSSVGATSEIFTGKITIPEGYPALVYYIHPLGDDSKDQMQVYVIDNGNYVQLQSINMVSDNNMDNGWRQCRVNLQYYAGKTVQIAFRGVVQSYIYLPLDDISLDQNKGLDLEITSIEAPAEVSGGKSFDVNFKVHNAGMETIQKDGYEVKFYVDGEEYPEPITARRVGTTATITYTIPYTFSLDAPEGAHTFSARVILEGDEDTTNDASQIVSVNLTHPTLYPVTDLTASIDDNNNVTLAWSEPEEPEIVYAPTTDTFDTYPALADETWGEWTVRDVDGLTRGGVQNAETGLEGKPGSFFIFDASAITDSDLAAVFKPHSGNQFAACLYPMDESNKTQLDDWMISPRLPGMAQTISFWARSLSSQYPETFEVLYSTSDTEIANFTLLDTKAGIPAQWTEYTFQLPEGARYFAIRCTSDDCLMLMIDDVTFASMAGGAAEVSLLGFNVYHEGELLNEEPTGEFGYVHQLEADGNDHSYYVKAVYDRGESPASNVVLVRTVGIEQIVAPEAGAARYFDVKGIAVERPAKGNVYIEVMPDGSARKVYIK